MRKTHPAYRKSDGLLGVRAVVSGQLTSVSCPSKARTQETCGWQLPWQGKRLDETEALDGFDYPFLDPETAVFNAPKGGILDAVTGHFVDVHRAASQALHAFNGLVERARDDAGAEAVGRGIGEGNGVVEVAHGQDRGQWPETLARHHARVARDVCHDGWLEQGTLSPAADQDLRARRDGFVENRFEINCRRLIDDRSDPSRFVHRIPAYVFQRFVHQSAGELGRDPGLDQDAFDRGAALA